MGKRCQQDLADAYEMVEQVGTITAKKKLPKN